MSGDWPQESSSGIGGITVDGETENMVTRTLNVLTDHVPTQDANTTPCLWCSYTTMF